MSPTDFIEEDESDPSLNMLLVSSAKFIITLLDFLLSIVLANSFTIVTSSKI